MGRQLDKADSFNSSGATIIPDKPRTRSRTRQDQAPHVANLSDARMLMPADSLGRDLNNVLASQSLQDLIAQYCPPTSSTSPLAPQPSQTFSDFDNLLNPSSQPSDSQGLLGNLATTPYDFSQLQLDLDHPPPSPLHHPHPQHQASNLNGPPTPLRTVDPLELTRPTSSASSHRSSISGSEHSWELSTTDTDGDGDERMGMDAEVGDGWRRYEGRGVFGEMPRAGAGGNEVDRKVFGGGQGDEADGSQYPTPGPSGSGSPPDHKADGLTEEERRQRKVEHRRSINRRSAQKHRHLKKQQIASLSSAVHERDQTIALLQRELAIKTAQLGMVLKMVKNQAAGGERPE